MYFSLQLPFLDAIWWGEWYLTNGSGHNQIKINLTTLNNTFSHIRQVILYGIFNFLIPRMLEALGVSESQLPFWDATGVSDRVFCTTVTNGRAQTL